MQNDFFLVFNLKFQTFLFSPSSVQNFLARSPMSVRNSACSNMLTLYYTQQWIMDNMGNYIKNLNGKTILNISQHNFLLIKHTTFEKIYC